MTQRNPLVLISGSLSELPPGDSVAGATPSLVPNSSGLYTAGGALGIDGSAQASGNAALALGVELELTKTSESDVIGLVIALS